MKATVLIFGSLLIAGAMILAASWFPQAEAVSPAAKQIEAMASKARFHNGALRKLAGLADKATHNQDAILRIAELTSAFGYHTGGLVQVAQIASETNFESPYFKEIAPLVVMKLSETLKVVDLARMAQKVKTKADQDALERAIQGMRETANFKTLEEALKYNESQMKGLF